MSTGAWVFVHIMLLVYWLGADLGVFILALAVRRADLGFDQRALLLKYAMVIDQLPRVCFALMLPCGLHLARSAGYLDVPAGVLVAAWAVSAAWLWLLHLMNRAEGTPRQAALNRINLLGQGVFGVVMIAAGIALLAGAAGPVAPWLSLKVLLFGLIFPAAIMIDVAFRPIVPAFGRLATEGSSPEVEAVITRTVNHAIVWVLAVYGLVIVISFLGAVKPH